MMNRVTLLLLLIVLAGSVACHRPAVSQSKPPEPTPSVSTAEPKVEPEQLIDIFVDKDRLLHHGFEVRRLKKTIDYEDPDGKHSSTAIDVSYTVIKRTGKVVAKFEGPYFAAGNYTDFGLFNLLGDESQQLIIATTVFRGGRHWVVSFVPEFRVLFDSDEFDVGREEFCVIDLDKDGVYEISLPVTAFYSMHDKMYIGEIPLPEIVFKYDARQRKYLPANHLYVDYAMRGLAEDQRKLDKEGNYLSRRLRILLHYIFAGKETEGWAFFDSSYQQSDKQEMKSRIQSVLNNQPVYRYLHQHR